jgi:hypothetical protein
LSPDGKPVRDQVDASQQRRKKGGLGVCIGDGDCVLGENKGPVELIQRAVNQSGLGQSERVQGTVNPVDADAQAWTHGFLKRLHILLDSPNINFR